MPTVYSTTPPDLMAGYVAPPVILSARKPVPAPIVKPKATTVLGAPTTVANPAALNPAPQAGQGPYGKVPGPIEYPTTPYAEATRIYPGMTALTPQAMEEIRSQIAGEFTPAEENALWDVSNRFGVQSGMPGAQLWSNRFMGNRVEEGMKRRQQGVQNYESVLNLLSKLGVDPALAAEIANRNANLAAAPDPEAAAKALEAAYRNAAVNPAGGTMQSPLGRGTYGQGYTFPTFPAWRNEPVNPYNPNPFSPNAPNPYGTSPAAGTANPNAVPEMSSRTEADLINEWLDYIDPVAAGYGNTTEMTPEEYDWAWESATPVENYNPFPSPPEITPMYEDEFNWLWNEAEPTDPWAIYDQG